MRCATAQTLAVASLCSAPILYTFSAKSRGISSTRAKITAAAAATATAATTTTLLLLLLPLARVERLEVLEAVKLGVLQEM